MATGYREPERIIPKAVHPTWRPKPILARCVALSSEHAQAKRKARIAANYVPTPKRRDIPEGDK